MKKVLFPLLLLVAQSSVALAQTFIVPMGYNEPWTGKLLYNSEGGYNTYGKHAWEKLYEAQSDDVYTITMPTVCRYQDYGRVQFKTPITLQADHTYRFRLKLKANNAISNVGISLCANEDDGYSMVNGTTDLTAGKEVTISRVNVTGADIEDAKIALGFPTTTANTVITLSGISIYDQTEQRELWAGTSFYNWCYYADEYGSRIVDMQIDGRNETLSWTQADFDDSQWAQTLMPIGSTDVSFIQSIWPGGDNTNFWFRRTFTLDEVHTTSKYVLHVLHDDNYRVWVNGVQLDAADNWTVGTSAVKLEVMASLLHAGTNVIAAYVQQNWGGKLYDCGLTEEEDYYEDYDLNADPSGLIINEIQHLAGRTLHHRRPVRAKEVHAD